MIIKINTYIIYYNKLGKRSLINGRYELKSNKKKNKEILFKRITVFRQ